MNYAIENSFLLNSLINVSGFNFLIAENQGNGAIAE